jgi:hypothetical protein
MKKEFTQQKKKKTNAVFQVQAEITFTDFDLCDILNSEIYEYCGQYTKYTKKQKTTFNGNFSI